MDRINIILEVINLLPIISDAYNLYSIRLPIYVLFQWSSPIHVHVVKGDSMAKFSINPVTLIENYGMSNSEVKMIESIIEENEEIIAEHWNNFFNRV